MSISDYLENELLDAVFNAAAFGLAADPYVSLHTADPGENGANEVAGGGYARQQAAFAAAAVGATTNEDDIDFSNMPAKTMTHVGIWDALAGGNFLWGGALATPRTTDAGDVFRLFVGDLNVTLD